MKPLYRPCVLIQTIHRDPVFILKDCGVEACTIVGTLGHESMGKQDPGAS